MFGYASAAPLLATELRSIGGKEVGQRGRERQQPLPLLDVQGDGEAGVQPVDRHPALLADLAVQGSMAVALRGGLELGKGLLLRNLAVGKLRQNVRVPLPVTDYGRYAGALEAELETGRVAVDIVSLLSSEMVLRAIRPFHRRPVARFF